MALLKAYKKFGLKPSRQFSDAFYAQLSTSEKVVGNATAHPDPHFVEYLVPVTIGGQTLNLDFDTGSADLWVFSTLLPSNQQANHSIYDPKKSPSYKPANGTWSIIYLDGSGANGIVGTDTVVIGGIPVKDQVVELATKVSGSFISDASDGLVGLAFSITPTPAKTWFDNAQQSLDAPVFGVYLPFRADGSYDFGAIDSSKFTGEIQYANVQTKNGYWEFDSQGYKVGSTSGSVPNQTAIADTGTTLFLTGNQVLYDYYKQVNGSSHSDQDVGFIFPCDAKLPDLSVQIGDNYATVPGHLMNFAPAVEKGKCYGAVQSAGISDQAVHGDIFLNANYGVFDASGPKFGFAPIA